VIRRVAGLRCDGIIREISGIFDLPTLGYTQSLVAFYVDPSHLEAAGAAVALHPGVSHCYGRAGDFNLWFTVAVSPSSGLGLEGTVAKLERIAGAKQSMILPCVRKFKLAARFGALGAEPGSVETQQPEADRIDITDLDRATMRALQTDLPACEDPFARLLPEGSAISAEDLLQAAAGYLQAKVMRRYAAVLFHRRAGARSNVMVVWRVQDSAMDEAGRAAAAEPAVSHCYQRPVFPDWPYSLYTMIHGANDDEARRAVRRIGEAIGLGAEDDRIELWTAAEFAKRRVKLFGPEEEQWEANTAD
jgi:DNA-binding Lrp family transcriptional regulator